MTDVRIPMANLARSQLAGDAQAIEAVTRVLQSGRYLLGPETEGFEAELASFMGIRHAVSVASGTDALTLALLAVGASSGTEVILAANAGGYGSIACEMTGASRVYADVHGESACVTAASVAACITDRTKAVIVTHLYGNQADIDNIVAFCRPRGIAVIEDCAQAIGRPEADWVAGTRGTVATFSFYPTKNLAAAGDAGALITDDAAVGERVRALRQYGWSTKYDIRDPGGRNSRMDEMQAALLRLALPGLEVRNARRRRILDHYRARSSHLAWVTGSTVTVAHLAVLRVPRRDVFRAALAADGIGTDVHYPVGDHRQIGLPKVTATLPVTDRLVDEVVSVPCHPDLTDTEVDLVADSLARFRP